MALCLAIYISPHDYFFILIVDHGGSVGSHSCTVDERLVDWLALYEEAHILSTIC
jgi:hypothetical protein